ncbi:proteasome assembly chaperone 2-like [Gigantopelta aegis]|uniref:proteasome assembly chaperone 2-like n=1 Tax=Gigantopelta aegis TaxID=1735272 RepID=UPI001B888267|nr:proteasome assembly chaperone 2-like [Gigantopelta aegis]
MFYPTDCKTNNWTNCTLILPTVSVGNVAQLAVDLLVSTLSMNRVGYILHESILPMCGNNPFASNKDKACRLCTSCEVFESSSDNFVVVQQRAPFIRGKKKIFFKWFSEWIRAQNFSRVIILTSSFAEERLDKQIQGSPLRFLVSTAIEKQDGELFRDKLNWQELELRPLPPGLSSENDNKPTVYIPGSGIAKNLFEDLSDLPVAMLLMFCSEGDNSNDAVTLVNYLNSWINVVTVKPKSDGECGDIAQDTMLWKVPISWRLVFGSKVDQTLFH